MGWFDDEDDDEEEEQQQQDPGGDHERSTHMPKKRLLSLTDFGFVSSGEKYKDAGSFINSACTTNNNNNNNNNDEGDDTKKQDPGDNHGDSDDVDPLDAYMKSLESSSSTSQTTKPSSMPAGARLDVENEDEATSHWQIHHETSHAATTAAIGGTSQTEAAESSAAYLDQTFHKASNAAQQDHRRVDFHLEQVQHDTMGYAPIHKNLWTAVTAYNNHNNTSQGHDWRREHSISCHPPLDPIYDFAQLRDVMPDAVMEWIAQHEGMTQPTLVQAQTLPVALSGKDAIVTASTGSGKTLAYLFPLVAHLVANNDPSTSTTTSRALVLVPTRELALQVEKVAKSLLGGKNKNNHNKLPFTALAITGGNMGRYQLSQTLLQRKPHLIVATPGRLLDVLSAQQKSKHQWLLTEITFLVLDEADKMLQLGFAAQVTQLLDNLRPDRQSLLTSATLQGRLENHCQTWMKAPTRISVGRSGTSSEHVQQHVVCLPSLQAKQAFLKESLPTFCQVGRTIVFCATREGCEQLAQLLDNTSTTSTTSADGDNTATIMMPALQTLHGDKHPSDRKAALKAFAKGQVRLLIATDVAGRGLDIPQVTTVINFDPAKNWDTHVHRIGRAGRLSADGGEKQQEGSAYTLLTPSNTEFAQTLVQAYQREGRAIGADVQHLANSSASNHSSYRSRGGGSGRGQGAGLGFAAGSETSRPYKKSRWS